MTVRQISTDPEQPGGVTFGEPILHNGKTLQVVFNYHPAVPRRDRRKHAVGCVIRYTGVEGEPDPEVLGQGLAYQNPEDRFDKRIGRRYAFERALEAAALGPALSLCLSLWFQAVCRQALAEPLTRPVTRAPRPEPVAA